MDEGWSENQIAAIPDLLDAPGDAVIVEGVEDGVPYTTYYVTYPQSRGVFQIGEGLILNVIVAADDGQSIWQLFDPSRTTADGHSTLIAETRTRAYDPWFKSHNGDILAVRKNLDTDVPTVVRLRLAWTESDANPRAALADDPTQAQSFRNRSFAIRHGGKSLSINR